MALINRASREISCKIVFYGPGLGGKTTNLRQIYQKVDPQAKSQLISLATELDRTLFFDFMPLDLGTIQGYKTKFHLYTVPGQVFYNASRKLVLRGVDGIVFVADSQRERYEDTLASFANLKENLAEMSLSIDTVPLVIQYNKRDLPNIVSLDELKSQLNDNNLSDFEAVASQGIGVFETLKEIARQVLGNIGKRSI
ncbi:MAG: gliding-motility protein MglA [Candidatus Edwardsbacteria bacterium]|nr:gliding-motility protein MglA [Candidatus Edwardsbacteria bacterium]MBU1576282.1 gliding-motility protein MglA [Candidatus Edwardsbacteria bacterium]MBU2463601.1 gliding-motility protein MglA [Candidatus Edwardsbacteria bacterium]MBU2593978.1 gliding-motility protein MglA [Candidatus Edwardsbacteria bacterium]